MEEPYKSIESLCIQIMKVLGAPSSTYPAMLDNTLNYAHGLSYPLNEKLGGNRDRTVRRFANIFVQKLEGCEGVVSAASPRPGCFDIILRMSDTNIRIHSKEPWNYDGLEIYLDKMTKTTPDLDIVTDAAFDLDDTPQTQDHPNEVAKTPPNYRLMRWRRRLRRELERVYNELCNGYSGDPR